MKALSSARDERSRRAPDPRSQSSNSRQYDSVARFYSTLEPLYLIFGPRGLPDFCSPAAARAPSPDDTTARIAPRSAHPADLPEARGRLPRCATATSPSPVPAMPTGASTLCGSARSGWPAWGRAPLVLPAPVAAEVDYLLGVRFGHAARRALLGDLAAWRYDVACFEAGDYRVVAELDARYSDLGLGLAIARSRSLRSAMKPGAFSASTSAIFAPWRHRKVGSFSLLPADS